MSVFRKSDRKTLLFYGIIQDKIKYKETSTKCAILFVGHTNLKVGIIMLKFQNNDTTIIATFEDFILTTYVIIDELYHRFAPSAIRYHGD